MAFLFVFVSHTLAINNDLTAFLQGTGKIGVWLFFVLSSFLLTYYFVKQPHKAKDPLEWCNYMIRRFLRIFPLYIAVLVIYYIFHVGVASSEILKNHILLQEGMMHFWTMPVEINYYFVLPLVVLILIYVLRCNNTNSLIALIVLIVLHQHLFPTSHYTYNSINLLQYLPVFLMGSVSALLHVNLSKKKLSTVVQVAMDIICVIILVGFIIATPGIRHALIGIEPSGYLVNKFIYCGAFWSMFLIFALNGRGYIRRFFELRVLRFIGGISYSAYLIHWLIRDMSLNYFKQELSLLYLCFMIAGTLISSLVLNKLIEEPLSRVSLYKNNSQVIVIKTR